MFSKIKTFLELPLSHKFIFIKILTLVPLVELGIKTIKFKRTFNVLNYFISKNINEPDDQSKIINRHTNFLYLYQKQMPFLGQCLARSMTLWFLLARKGIKTDLKFGMKKEKDDLLAHSWLEHQGEALLTESEMAENYVPFDESILTKTSDLK